VTVFFKTGITAVVVATIVVEGESLVVKAPIWRQEQRQRQRLVVNIHVEAHSGAQIVHFSQRPTMICQTSTSSQNPIGNQETQGDESGKKIDPSKGNLSSTPARLRSSTALSASIKDSTPNCCSGKGSLLHITRRTPLSSFSPSVRERLKKTDVNTLRHLTNTMQKATSRASFRKHSLDIPLSNIKKGVSITKQKLYSETPSEEKGTDPSSREGYAESASDKSKGQEVGCGLENKEHAARNGDKHENTLSSKELSCLDSPSRYSVSDSYVSGIESLLDGIDANSNGHEDENALTGDFDSRSYMSLESNPSAKASEASLTSPTRLDVTHETSDNSMIQNSTLSSSADVSRPSTLFDSPACSTRTRSRGSGKKRHHSPFLHSQPSREDRGASNSRPNSISSLLKPTGQKAGKPWTPVYPTPNAEQKHSIPRNARPLPTAVLQDFHCDSPRRSAPMTSPYITDSPAKNTRSSCGKRCMPPGTPLFPDESCRDGSRSRKKRSSILSELTLSPSLFQTSHCLEARENKEGTTAPFARSSVPNPTGRQLLSHPDRAGRHCCGVHVSGMSVHEATHNGSCSLRKSVDNLYVDDVERSPDAASRSFGDNAALDKTPSPSLSEKRKATLDLADFRALFNEEMRKDTLPSPSPDSNKKMVKTSDSDCCGSPEPENGDTVELDLLHDLFGPPVSNDPSSTSPVTSNKASMEKPPGDKNEAVLPRRKSTVIDVIGDRAVSFAAPPAQSPRFPKRRLASQKGEVSTCKSSNIDASLVPKSILNSAKKTKKGGPFSIADPLSTTKMRTRIVAFGSPVAAEYNKTSPSMSMTPLPASRVKNLFSIPASQSDSESSMSFNTTPASDSESSMSFNTTPASDSESSMSFNTTPASEGSSRRELGRSIDSTTAYAPDIAFAHENTANLEADVNALLLNAQCSNFGGHHELPETVVPTKLLNRVEGERYERVIYDGLQGEDVSLSDDYVMDTLEEGSHAMEGGAQNVISEREDLTVELEGRLFDILEEASNPCSKSPSSAGTLSTVKSSQPWAEKRKTVTGDTSSEDDQTLKLEENLGYVLQLSQTEFKNQSPTHGSTSHSLSNTPIEDGRESCAKEDKSLHEDWTLELEENIVSLLRVNQAESKNQTFLPEIASRASVDLPLRDPRQRCGDGEEKWGKHSVGDQFECEASVSGGLSRPASVFEATCTLEFNMNALLAGDDFSVNQHSCRPTVGGSSETLTYRTEACASLDESAITPLPFTAATPLGRDEDNTRTTNSIEDSIVELDKDDRNFHMPAIGTPRFPTNHAAPSSVAFSTRSSTSSKRLSLGTPRKFSISPSGSVCHKGGIVINRIMDRDERTGGTQSSPNTEHTQLNLTYQEFTSLAQISLEKIDAESLMTSSTIVNSACNTDLNGQTVEFLENVSAEVEQRSLSMHQANENRFRLAFQRDSLPSIPPHEFLFSLGRVKKEDFQKKISDIAHLVSHQLADEWHQWEKCVTSALIENVSELSAQGKQQEGTNESMALLLRNVHTTISAASNKVARRARVEHFTKGQKCARGDTLEYENIQKIMVVLKNRRDDITMKNVILPSCLQLKSAGKEDLLELSRLHSISASSERKYKTAQEFVGWSLVQTQPTSLTMAFDSQGFFPCAQLVVPFDSKYEPVAFSVASLTKDRYGACCQFVTHHINCLKHALEKSPRASPDTILQHVHWRMRRGELISKELNVLSSRHKTILERIDSETIALTIDFVSRDESKKLRVCFDINECYPNSPMEVFLQPLHGEGVRVKALSRHLQKTARPGFGYISRSCEVIKAFLS
jgi:hypothetical protein